MEDIGFVVAVKNISKTLNEMWKFCCRVCDTITNPKDTITNPKDTMISLIDGSYWVLLITAMICFILTMCGCKKTKNGATISIIIYLILQCLKVVLMSI